MVPGGVICYIKHLRCMQILLLSCVKVGWGWSNLRMLHLQAPNVPTKPLNAMPDLKVLQEQMVIDEGCLATVDHT